VPNTTNPHSVFRQFRREKATPSPARLGISASPSELRRLTSFAKLLEFGEAAAIAAFPRSNDADFQAMRILCAFWLDLRRKIGYLRVNQRRKVG